MKYAYTSDLEDAFFTEHTAMCQRLGCSVADSLGVMMSESGVSASRQNPSSSATGLIQFMARPKGRYFGMTRKQFGELGATSQLKFVEGHYRPYVGKLGNDVAMYLAVFLPAQIGLATDPDAIVAAKTGPYGWAWESNTYFDFNKDNAIQVSELGRSIRLQCAGPRWTEIAMRAGIETNAVIRPRIRFNLGTVLGIQQALQTIGFDPGPLDGLAGKRTTSAVKVFQVANGLTADGHPGPLTRRALDAALRDRGLV